jgi:MoaA/NifB/PqqE/SkfB family radical SAM enzyme
MQARLDFLDRSGVDYVRLLGGEPTLHPRFVKLVRHGRAAGKKIMVFTNGRMPAPALACLEALPVEACTVLVNVHDPAAVPAGVGVQQRDTLRRLGVRARLSYNIHRTNFEPGFLLDLIAETGCHPLVRVGMAQPSLSGANRYIHPRQYRAVATRLAPFGLEAAAAGVRVDFDCGFVRCMFSDAELSDLRAAGVGCEWRCNPILDVDLEGNVLHCFPLARLGSLPLTPAADAAGLRAAFEARTRVYRQAGVYRECPSCGFKSTGECTGGCLSATIRRFHRASFRLNVPEPHRRAA